MEHLKIEEIIEFVSFTELSQKNIDLALKVNSHIRSCKECMEKVTAFQQVHDELDRLANGLDSNDLITEDEIEAYLETEDIINCINDEELESGLELDVFPDQGLNS